MTFTIYDANRYADGHRHGDDADRNGAIIALASNGADAYDAERMIDALQEGESITYGDVHILRR